MPGWYGGGDGGGGDGGGSGGGDGGGGDGGGGDDGGDDGGGTNSDPVEGEGDIKGGGGCSSSGNSPVTPLMALAAAIGLAVRPRREGD